jgi:hypothetical protein
MSNQTVTTNKTLEEVIAGGLNDGENIIINSGAVVTCTQTPSKLIGDVRIDEGELFIDGENISSGNVINFVGEYADEINNNGQGTFKIRGGWYSLGTTNGANSQTIDLTAYWGGHCIDVIPAIWIETGRRIDFDNASGTTPEVDDWVIKTSDRSVMGRIVEVQSTYLIVKFLTGTLADDDGIQVRKVVDDNGPDLQVSWTANVNNASGDIKEAGVYQAFGNCYQNSSSHIASFHHGVGGFVFENAHQSTTLTLGSAAGSTGGFRPPSGCNIRVPNVHFSTSRLAEYATSQTYHHSPTSYSGFYNLVTTYGGVVDWKVANFGTGYFGCTNASAFDAEFCGAMVDMGTRATSCTPTYYECVVVNDPKSRIVGNDAFRVVDVPGGAEIIDCMIVASETSGLRIGAETSIDIIVKGCIATKACTATWATSGIYCYRFSSVKNLTFHNNVAVGGDHSEFDNTIYLSAVANADIRNYRLAMTQSDTSLSNSKSCFNILTFTNNISIIGVEFIGPLPIRYVIYCSDLLDSKIRCIGMIDDKWDWGSNNANALVYLRGLSSNVSIARCWKDGGTVEELVLLDTAVSYIEVLNCSGKYASSFFPRGLNIKYRGLHAGAGSPGSGTGIEDTFSNTAGRQIHDGFNSDTTGFIVCFMLDPSTLINNVTVVSGNPKFFKDNDLNMASGDVIEFTQDYFAKGHTGFSGTYTACTGTSAWNANEWANVTLEFQYDVGSGWNGSWLNVRTATNWTGITVDPSVGAKLKFRFTATGTQNDMSSLIIDTTTTIAAQKANFYSIDQQQATITLNGLKAGSEVRILRASDDVELSGIESSGTSFAYQYTYTTDTEVVIVIHALSYLPQRIEGIILGTSNQTIPIQQIFDRQYENPA